MERVRDYAVIDLETTGFNPRSDRIIEIGILIVRDGVAQRADSVLVCSVDKLPEKIVQITSITDEMLKGGISINRALTWLVQTTWGLPIVGHNILKFDLPFLREESARARIDLGPMAKPSALVYDTAGLYLGQKLGATQQKGESALRFAQRVLAHPQRGVRYNLTEACESFGIAIDRDAMHRAATDVTATHLLFEALQSSSIDVSTASKEAARATLPKWMAATL
jgi:DNA polymerase III epsilon subunit-like protein